MSEKLIGSCIFGQSGGPTAVINASAYGVIRAALDAEEITKVYGAFHGIKGVLDDKLFVMDEEDPEELKLLLHTPSSELGSCRYKIADPEADDHFDGDSGDHVGLERLSAPDAGAGYKEIQDDPDGDPVLPRKLWYR